jgi:hypothetical protein
MEIYNSFLGCVRFSESSEAICWLIGYIYVNLFLKNQYTHMVCISGICNFEKLYPIHTLEYMHGISYLRGDVCQKSGASRLWKSYIYIKLVCGCFQFCQFLVGMSWCQYCEFADVSTFANLLECGLTNHWTWCSIPSLEWMSDPPKNHKI